MASRRKRSRTHSAASRARRDAERLASLTFSLDYQIEPALSPATLTMIGQSPVMATTLMMSRVF